MPDAGAEVGPAHFDDMDPQVLAHRDISTAPLDVVEARDLPLRVLAHSITSV